MDGAGVAGAVADGAVVDGAVVDVALNFERTMMGEAAFLGWTCGILGCIWTAGL